MAGARSQTRASPSKTSGQEEAPARIEQRHDLPLWKTGGRALSGEGPTIDRSSLSRARDLRSRLTPLHSRCWH